MKCSKAWKRMTAGAMALMMAAGTATAGVPWTELVGGTSLVASAINDSNGTIYVDEIDTLDPSVIDDDDKEYSIESLHFKVDKGTDYFRITGMYVDEDVTISAKNDEVIKKIVLHQSNEVELDKEYFTVSGGDIEIDGNNVTISNIDAVEFVFSYDAAHGYPMFDKVSIEYTGGEGVVATKTSLSEAKVIVNTETETVTVTLDDKPVPTTGYTLKFEGVNVDYTGENFPTDPGEYTVTATGIGDYEGTATSDKFTVTEQLPEETFTYNKDSEFIKSGVRLTPGTTVDLSGTKGVISFACDFTIQDAEDADKKFEVKKKDYFGDGDEWTVSSLSTDTEGNVLVKSDKFNTLFLKAEDKTIFIWYEPEADTWYIDQAFTKDSEAMAEPYVLQPDETVSFESGEQKTGKVKLENDTTLVFNAEDQEIPNTFNANTVFDGSIYFYFEDDCFYLEMISSTGDVAKFKAVPNEGKTFAISYNADEEMWSLKQIAAVKTSLTPATVAVNTLKETVTVTLDGEPVPETGYTLKFEGTDVNYSSDKFPTVAGTFVAKVTGIGDYEDEAVSEEFTVEASEINFKLLTEEDIDGLSKKLDTAFANGGCTEEEAKQWITEHFDEVKPEDYPAYFIFEDIGSYLKGRRDHYYNAIRIDSESENDSSTWSVTSLEYEFIDSGISDGYSKIYLLDAQTLKHVEAVDPTCEEDGNREFWYDKDTDTYYLDSEGKEPVDESEVVIPKLGHKYVATWKWAKDFSKATVTLNCRNDKTEDPIVLEAEITPEIIESTCSVKGKIIYHAMATYNNTDYTYSKEAELPLIDHTYGEPKWQWIDENTVKATFTCTDCGATETINAVIRSEKTAPTTTTAGKIVYTASATIGGHTYIDTRVKKLDKLPAPPTITYTPGANSVKLDWTAVNGAEKYAVCGETDGKWQIIGKGTDTTFALKDLTSGKQYKVAVLAKVNGEWIEDYSNAIVVSPKEAAAKYPKVTTIDYNDKYHQFKLNWDAVDGAEKYGVAVFLAGRWKIATQDIPANTTSFTSPKLKAGQTYKMVVCAKIGGKWDTSNLASRAFSVTVR